MGFRLPVSDSVKDYREEQQNLEAGETTGVAAADAMGKIAKPYNNRAEGLGSPLHPRS